MKSQLVLIKSRTTSAHNILEISQQLADRLGLQKQRIKLCFGNWENEFRIRVNKHSVSNEIVISKDYPIITPQRYCIWKQSESHFRIGPLVAILTANSRYRRGLFAGRSKFFQEIIQYGKKSGAVCFCLTPKGINRYTKSCVGYIWLKHKWQRIRLPLPDVVYNRVPSRFYEMHKSIKWAKAYFHSQNIPLFNPHFLNKSELNKIFINSPLSSLIPKTEHWSGQKQQLLRFLKLYKSVYLKPINSFAGHGIVKVTRNHNGIFVQKRNENNNAPHYYKNLNEAWPMIKKSGTKAMLLQQGIELVKYQKSVFDVRALMQRNGKGEWQLIGMGCRVAGEGRITTHVPNGGRIAAIDKVLAEAFKDRAIIVKKDLVSLLNQVPPIIEKYYQRQFGIISLDIGIDNKQHLWLFEANAKPMEFDEIDTQQYSLKNLLDYCKYLTINSKQGGMSW